jgi:hypothetical protein
MIRRVADQYKWTPETIGKFTRAELAWWYDAAKGARESKY